MRTSSSIVQHVFRPAPSSSTSVSVRIRSICNCRCLCLLLLLAALFNLGDARAFFTDERTTRAVSVSRTAWLPAARGGAAASESSRWPSTASSDEKDEEDLQEATASHCDNCDDESVADVLGEDATSISTDDNHRSGRREKENQRELLLTACETESQTTPKTSSTTIQQSTAPPAAAASLMRESSGVIKTRRASDIIVDLLTRSWIEGGSIQEESRELRNLISQRTDEYLSDLDTAIAEGDDKLPHPKRLLHFLAPKIPAIKHSPDVALRIQSARSDIDSGVAACLLGTMGRVCELYEKECGCVADGIVGDRRFEQLVECVLCGVDVKRRREEWALLQEQDVDDSVASQEDFEEIVHEAHLSDGLSIRDCCRAAWGISILGSKKLEIIGGFPISDILAALALRSRELLLVRLQKLRQSDLYIESDEALGLSIDERLRDFSEELAEDAASAMWTFACVKAFTGFMFNPLFEVCYSILCTDPFDLRRRAQEEEANIDTESVGSNDIVDRLAISEAEADDEDGVVDTGAAFSKEDMKKNSVQTRTALIDWLSPKELTDVAWSLALHTATKNGTATTDIHETFRDVVFGRAHHWVREELQYFESSLMEDVVKGREAPEELHRDDSLLDPDIAPSTVEDEGLQRIQSLDENMQQVQVGDATALLAAETACVAGEDMLSTDGLQVPHDRMTPQTEYVQVVDAAALLASESTDSIHIMDSATLPVLTNDGDKADDPDSSRSSREEGSDMADNLALDNTDGSEKDQPLASFSIFTPHDLCSLAWSVTELNDSLRREITGAVAKIFVQTGPSSLVGLSGGDLSNLAWALAKNLVHKNGSKGTEDFETLLIGWITDEVLQDTTGKIENVVQRFHPPEFSRLLYAVAEIYTTRLGGTRMAGSDVSNLVSVGLLAAARNLDVFGAEDLARIVWAFLSLSNGFTDTKHRSSVQESLALGKILASIETCLFNWENCKPSFIEESGSDSPSTREAIRFASFLGRSRRHIPFLDQRMDDSDELFLPLHTEKSRLPLLRDLPIDPLTLCKLACRLERLADSQKGIHVTETLTRIALRLLTSRSGRLMKECPINDLVRMCEAAARNDSPSTRELVSHFSRRLVLHLNGPGKDDIFTLSSGHHAMLLWALGELGVKYTPNEIDDAETAHRRLHLVSPVPFLNREQVITLSHTRAARMVRGLVNLRVVAVEKRPLVDFLKFLENRIASIQDESVICHMMHSLGSLKMAVEATEANVKEISSPMGTDEDSNTTSSNSKDEETLEDSFHNETTASDAEVAKMCDIILTRLSARATEIIQNLTAQSLREILMSLSLLPLQADDCVDAIEREVLERVQFLGVAFNINIDELLQQIASDALNAKRALFGDDEPKETKSHFAGLKEGIKAMFGTSKASDHSDGEQGDVTTASHETSVGELAANIKHSLQSIAEAATTIVNATAANSKSSLDQMIVSSRQEDLFELGRCTELIEQYRRIDFASGSRRSRFDEDRRRDMAKRLLSRKLP